MKALAIRGYKAPMEMMELPRPEPGPGELRVRVRAAGVGVGPRYSWRAI